MKAIVTDDCILCGLCPEICPEVFELGPEKAMVKLDPVPPEHEEKSRQAADECPTDAIVLE